jgi:biopolymer transport protein ExbD
MNNLATQINTVTNTNTQTALQVFNEAGEAAASYDSKAKSRMTNAFSWAAFFIIKNLHDAKQSNDSASVYIAQMEYNEAKESVANRKDFKGKFNKIKGAFSYAEQVFNYLNEGGEVILKDGDSTLSVTLESLQDCNHINQPDIALSSLYKGVKLHTNSEKQSKERQEAINKRAEGLLIAKHKMPLLDIITGLGKDQFNEELTQAKEEAEQQIIELESQEQTPYNQVVKLLESLTSSELQDISDLIISKLTA